MKSRQHFLFIFIVLASILSIIFSPEVQSSLFQQTKLDTIGHFLSFFCLALLVHYIVKLPLIITLLCLIFYAALTELGQYYLGFRHGEFRDFIADILGISVFTLFAWGYQLYRKVPPKNKRKDHQ